MRDGPPGAAVELPGGCRRRAPRSVALGRGAPSSVAGPSRALDRSGQPGSRARVMSCRQRALRRLPRAAPPTAARDYRASGRGRESWPHRCWTCGCSTKGASCWSFIRATLPTLPTLADDRGDDGGDSGENQRREHEGSGEQLERRHRCCRIGRFRTLGFPLGGPCGCRTRRAREGRTRVGRGSTMPATRMKEAATAGSTAATFRSRSM